MGNILFRILCGAWTEDSQCGFKLFSNKAAQICFQKVTIKGWGFDMEMFTIAKINRLKVKSLRIDDWESKPGGSFTDAVLKNSVISFVELLYILSGRITGRYRDKI